MLVTLATGLLIRRLMRQPGVVCSVNTAPHRQEVAS